MADSGKEQIDKKPYHPPELREYGDINSLTEGVGGQGVLDGDKYLGYVDLKTGK